MKINIEKGIIRVLYVLSCAWALFTIVLIVIGIKDYHKPHIDFRPDFVDTIKYPLTKGLTIFDKISGFFSQYWGEAILTLLIPIILIWFLFALIKYLTIPFISWIIAGFQDK